MWPDGTVWQLRTRSTLVHLIACYLTEPIHYLNQYWLIICKVSSTHWGVNCDVELSRHCPSVQNRPLQIPINSVHRHVLSIPTHLSCSTICIETWVTASGWEVYILRNPLPVQFCISSALVTFPVKNKYCGLHRWVESARRSLVQRSLNVADRCGTTNSRTNGIPPIALLFWYYINTNLHDLETHIFNRSACQCYWYLSEFTFVLNINFMTPSWLWRRLYHVTRNELYNAWFATAPVGDFGIPSKGISVMKWIQFML